MKRYANKKHLGWIHDHECIMSKWGVCGGGIQAHHLMRPWSGHRGTGLKANDRNLVPLCHAHHTKLHFVGDEDLFFEHNTGHPDFGRRRAQRLWLESPHYEKEP
jgi:hypothetical protein